MTFDLMLLLRGIRTVLPDPETLPVCTFHVHAKEEEGKFPVDLNLV